MNELINKSCKFQSQIKNVKIQYEKKIMKLLKVAYMIYSDQKNMTL